MHRKQVVKEFWQEAASQGGGFFTGEQLMWHRPVGGNAVGCSSHVDAVIDFVLLGTPQQWLAMLFNGPDNHQYCPLLLGDVDPHLIRGSLGHPSQLPKRHLDCRAHFYAQQTDRHTDHATCDICSNRPHLYKARDAAWKYGWCDCGGDARWLVLSLVFSVHTTSY